MSVGVQLFLVSCSGPKTGPPPATGVTPALSRSSETTLYWVDEVGDVKNPYQRKSIEVSAAAPFKVRGWAVDERAQGLAGGVDVVIDNVAYAARYGIERADVADARKNAAYRNSGFEFSMSADQLSKDSHTLTIRFIASDRKTYYETPALVVTIH